MNDKKLFHIGINKGDCGRYVILPGDPGRCKSIADLLDNAKKTAQNREFTIFTGTLLGEKVSVCSTGIGGPSAAIAVEELFMAGADTFIRVGTCGGIGLKVQGGDLVIALSAVRQEGTGLHYQPIEFPACADYSVIKALEFAAKAQTRPLHIGIVQSKDSFYGQHQPERMPVSHELLSKWEAWKKGGVLASEMETAAIYIVASCLGCRCGAVLHCIWNPEREKAGMSNVQDNDTSAAVMTAVEAVKKIILTDKGE